MILLIIFFAFLFIQLIYFLIVFRSFLSYNECHDDQPKSVSVIIAAHNEYHNLKKLLPLLVSQEYPDYEIIISNDRSIDQSKELLNRYAEAGKIKVIHILEKQADFDSKKFALKSAIERSSKDILLLTDADCFPVGPNWIKEMVGGFKDDTSIVLGYSPYSKRNGLLNLLIRFETFYTAVQYFSFAALGNAYMGIGRNMAYRRKLFASSGGFNGVQQLTGGDDDLLIQKIAPNRNVNLIFNKNSQMVSVPKESWSAWLKQKTRHLSAGNHYNLSSRISLGALTISHIGIYALSIYLLLTGMHTELALSGLIFRTVAVTIVLSLFSKKLNDKFVPISLPLLDFLYIINYILVGIRVVISRNTSWK